ncbi:MAG: DUF1566 domain-containing protein [Pirellulales bacterium]|nr:DUF1566 domain-containing protein [Pirellulales bacterium]
MRTLTFIVCALCAGIASLNARATLTPYNAGGIDLVYSSVSDVTWLQHGNLLGSWINASGAQAVFDAIADKVPTVTLSYSFSGPEVHTLVLGDYSGAWGADGRATFYGAFAFVEYLNAVSYGGINGWRLPDAINTVYPNPFPSGYVKSGDFGQLYYDELNSTFTGMADPLNYFTDEVHAQYWSFTLFDNTDIVQPYGFHVGQGDQYFLNKDFPFYVWPVFSGQIAVVPELSSAWLAGPVLLFAAALGRRKGTHISLVHSAEAEPRRD